MLQSLCVALPEMLFTAREHTSSLPSSPSSPAFPALGIAMVAVVVAGDDKRVLFAVDLLR